MIIMKLWIWREVKLRKYRKVASTSRSHFEVHAGIFRLLMKGIFDAYVLWSFDKKLILVMRIRTCNFPVHIWKATGKLFYFKQCDLTFFSKGIKQNRLLTVNISGSFWKLQMLAKNAITNLLQKSYHKYFAPKKKESNWIRIIIYDQKLHQEHMLNQL